MSLAITKPLVSSIDCQALRADMAAIKNEQAHCKRVVRKEGQNERKLEAEKVIKSVSPKQQRCTRAAQEKGTSSWLSVVPIKDLGFALHKRAFRDALALRYGWPLHLVPSLCRCGEPFEVDHVMSCRHGGFHTLRHNEIRDLLAGLFREVCHDVSVEPCLQPLTGEQFPASTNKSDEARLDIRARGFWGTGRGQQDAFFDVRVFYPFASSYRNSRLPTLYRQHESQKRLHYGHRVREVERGCFTPLVFTSGGGMAPEATVCLKRLASMLSDKREESYSTIMGWLRCAISFSLLRSSLACLRGSTKSGKDPTPTINDACEATASARL